MTLPRSAADVINDHVVFEIESIDRAYCNLYVPRLQRELGVEMQVVARGPQYAIVRKP